MVKIYTKKGDDGTTSLWYGGRVPKDSTRTEAYGSLDEACSALGVARALCTGGDGSQELAADILRLQDDLFVAGAELATAPEAAGRLEDGISRVTPAMIAEAEALIDRYMAEVELPPKFVIPGGNLLSAQLDVARTLIRRAERRISTLAEDGELADDTVIGFVNRASDLAYAMARWADVDDPALFEGRGQELMGAHVVARRIAGFAHEVDLGDGREIVVDEPAADGGTDTGPRPTQLLATSLAGCTAITIELYANRKGWDLDGLEVEVDMKSDAERRPTHFAVEVALPAGLDDEQRRKLMTIAEKCPVHKLLEHGAEITLAERALA